MTATPAAIEEIAALHRAGELEVAEAGYRELLASGRHRFDASQLLAALLQQTGRREEARAMYEVALQIRPDIAELRSNYGSLLYAEEDYSGAIEQFDAALRLQPHYVEALKNRALAQEALKDHEAALQDYRSCTRLAPEQYDLWVHQGVAEFNAGRLNAAAISFATAMALEAGRHQARYWAGRVGKAQLRYTEARVFLESALAIAPHYLPAMLQLAETDFLVHMHADALEKAGEVLARAGDDSIPLRDKLRDWDTDNDLSAERQAERLRDITRRGLLLCGAALYQLRRFEDAIRAYSQLLVEHPDDLDALEARSGAYIKKRYYDLAITDLERLVELDTGQSRELAQGTLLIASRCACRWGDLDRLESAVLKSLEDGKSSIRPFLFLTITDSSARQQHCAQLYNRFGPEEEASVEEPPATVQAAAPGRRLRVAYISPDFKHHAVSFLTAGVYEQHDRQEFEVIGVALTADDGSPYRARVAAAFDRFIDAARMSDSELVKELRALELDVAVDLAGFTDFSRPLVFAHRVAPVQVNYLGYPATMGKRWMDYIIVDRYLVPEGHERFYTEQPIFMPHCFQANDDKRKISTGKPSRKSLGLPAEGVILCTANQSHKIHPTVFRCWMDILKAAPGSCLWVLGISDDIKQRLDEHAAAQGVDPGRLYAGDKVFYPDHLSRLRVADLMLDTWPFNGGTTSSDALWAGVPILTLSGDALAARMSGSLLRTIGVPELITDSLDSYRQRAITLVNDPEALREIRQRIWTGRKQSPLFDTARFTRHLEAALREACRRHRAGEPPAPIEVQAD